MVAKYDAAMTQRRYMEASSVFGDCARFTEATDLRDLIAKAEQQRYLSIITDKKQPAKERLAAFRSLDKDFPEAAKPHLALVPALEKSIEQQNAADEKRAASEERKKRKSEGVRIGMTQDEVLMSSWGRPEHINRTTTAYGTREQWVYGSRSYLYFRDGVLESIQN